MNIHYSLSGKRTDFERPDGSARGVILVFGLLLDDLLYTENFIKKVNAFSGDEVLCVALDLPCHGDDARAGEENGLEGWRNRLQNGEPIFPTFLTKISSILDELIAEGLVDPDRISACGTSRGGFMALHFAAADSRVKRVVAFAPVVDLLALREFEGLDYHPVVNALALAHHAPRIAALPIWLCIGNHDLRVDTDRVIAFSRQVVAAAVAQNITPNIEVHIMPAQGHTLHETAYDEAWAWLRKVEKIQGV